MKRLLGSVLIPVGLCALALGFVIYGYVARTTLYTTGDAPRPLSGFGEPYYATWTAPRAADADVFTADGDIHFADSRITSLINTPHGEQDPIESPDGKYLVFASARPDGEGGTDLWWSRREGNGYSPPALLPGTINTVFNERSPSLAPIGGGEYLLAFASNRSFGGAVDHDLFVSRGKFGEPWSAPKLLTSLSTGADERSLAMFPSGDAVVFSRPGITGIEYWESWALPGGVWSEPRNLAALNHPDNEARLILDAGGMELTFARGGELWRSNLRLLRPLPKPPFSLAPAWVLLALAILLLLLRLLSLKWRGLEVIYWCLLISLLLHLLLWWLFRDEGLEAPVWESEGPDGNGMPPIEFTLDMFDQNSGEPAVQAAQGDTVQEIAQAEAESASSEFARRELAAADATAPAPAEATLREVSREAPDASATEQQSSVATSASPETEARFEEAPGIALQQQTESSASRDQGSEASAEAQSSTAETHFADARSRQADSPDRPNEFNASSSALAQSAAAAPQATSSSRSSDSQLPAADARVAESAQGIQLADGERTDASRSERTGAPTRTEISERRVSKFGVAEREGSAGRPSAPENAEVRLAGASAAGQPAASGMRDRVSASSALVPTQRPSTAAARPQSPTLADASGSATTNERRAENRARPSGSATVESEVRHLVARSTDGKTQSTEVSTPSQFTDKVATSSSASPQSAVSDARRVSRESALPATRRDKSGEAASLASAPKAAEANRQELAEASAARATDASPDASRFTGRSARPATDVGLPTSDAASVSGSIAASAKPSSSTAPVRVAKSMTPSLRPRAAAASQTGSALASSEDVRRDSEVRGEVITAAAAKSASPTTSSFRPTQPSRRPTTSATAESREIAMTPRISATPAHSSTRRSRSSFLPQAPTVEARRVSVRDVEGTSLGSVAEPAAAAERRESSLALAPATTATPLSAGLPFPSRSRSVTALSRPTASPNVPRISATAQVTTVAKKRDRVDGLVAWLSARVGPKKQQALEKFGGDDSTEAAVAAGLEYLDSIQRRDGSWGTRSLDEKYGETRIGVSALSLLAFLGAGHFPGSGGPYDDAVSAAIDYLLSEQMARTGHFGEKTASYSHGIATYALGEAYLLSRDERILEPLRRAVQQVARYQQIDPDQEDYFGGWSYYYHRGQIADRYPRVSVTVWQIMALKTAQLAGIDVEDARLKAARFFLVNSWSNRLGRILYTRKPQRLSSNHPTLPGSTPAAVFGLLLLKESRDSAVVRRGVEMVLDHLPRRWKKASTADFIREAKGNGYFMYYSTLAMFMHGGAEWSTWNNALKRTLVPSQSRDGSWRPISVYAEYAGDTDKNRPYTTALNVLMLEVYYRYLTPLLEKSSSGR